MLDDLATPVKMFLGRLPHTRSGAAASSAHGYSRSSPPWHQDRFLGGQYDWAGPRPGTWPGDQACDQAGGSAAVQPGDRYRRRTAPLGSLRGGIPRLHQCGHGLDQFRRRWPSHHHALAADPAWESYAASVAHGGYGHERFGCDRILVGSEGGRSSAEASRHAERVPDRSSPPRWPPAGSAMATSIGSAAIGAKLLADSRAPALRFTNSDLVSSSMETSKMGCHAALHYVTAHRKASWNIGSWRAIFVHVRSSRPPCSRRYPSPKPRRSARAENPTCCQSVKLSWSIGNRRDRARHVCG